MPAVIGFTFLQEGAQNACSLPHILTAYSPSSEVLADGLGASDCRIARSSSDIVGLNKRDCQNARRP